MLICAFLYILIGILFVITFKYFDKICYESYDLDYCSDGEYPGWAVLTMWWAVLAFEACRVTYTAIDKATNVIVAYLKK